MIIVDLKPQGTRSRAFYYTSKIANYTHGTVIT